MARSPDHYLQVELGVEIFLGGLDVGVPEQDADLLNANALTPA
jgi:hypothetical protein